MAYPQGSLGYTTGGLETLVILNITPNEIQQFSTNGKVHALGKRYYTDRRIQSLRYDPAAQCFTADVSGSKIGRAHV